MDHFWQVCRDAVALLGGELVLIVTAYIAWQVRRLRKAIEAVSAEPATPTPPAPVLGAALDVPTRASKPEVPPLAQSASASRISPEKLALWQGVQR